MYEYIFWVWAVVPIVGDTLCYEHKYRVHGVIGFPTYGECWRDGEDIARSGFTNYEITVQGGCFQKEMYADD